MAAAVTVIDSAALIGSVALIGWAALGGGVGAALRFAVDVAITSRWRRPFPLATFLVNLSGSLALGLLVGAVSGPTALALVGTGVLGGYTTFSTASYDAIRLARAGHRGMALSYAAGTMLLTVVAAAVGLWLGAWWTTVG